MPSSLRGTTRTGQPAALPSADYSEPAPIDTSNGALTIKFRGEDGRERTFDISELPLPGWHRDLALAWAIIVGPSGRLRTRASAVGAWYQLFRFVHFLASLPHPPEGVADLTAGHLEAFRRHRQLTVGEHYVWNDIRGVRSVLSSPPIKPLVSAEVLDYCQRKLPGLRATPQTGYSRGEYASMLKAARQEIRAVEARLATSATLLEQAEKAPHELAHDQRDLARQLSSIAATGQVPVHRLSGVPQLKQRRSLASHLFLTHPDLVPLMVLLVALTGRNSETIKELPAEHRVLQDRAVEVRIVKRRRGRRRWFETVTWEIGPHHSRLNSPGGIYLLAHQLMSRSRELIGDESSLWSTWRNSLDGRFPELGNPFSHRLDVDLQRTDFAHRNQLFTDQTDPDQPARPLTINLGRLKTTADTLRTRQLGGHLPSAARSNSIPVLFSNYLRGDPTIIDWAHDVVADALVDAEQAAIEAHQRLVESHGGGPRTAPPTDIAEVTETGWSGCSDPDHNPATGKACDATLLTCLHCSNCLITNSHLPHLLALNQTLLERRDQMPQADWWARYGPAWVALTNDVLPRFTPAEVAAADPVTNPVNLDLIEHPWQRP